MGLLESDLAELPGIVARMRELGVARLTIGALDIYLGPAPAAPSPERPKEEPAPEKTLEDRLFRTPGFKRST